MIIFYSGDSTATVLPEAMKPDDRLSLMLTYYALKESKGITTKRFLRHLEQRRDEMKVEKHPPYSREQVDEVLEAVQDCERREAMTAKLAAIAKKWERHQPDAYGRQTGDALRRLVWGLAMRLLRQHYKGPTSSRTRRAGPLSAGEKWIVKIAATGQTNEEQVGPPDPHYISFLLQRDLALIEKEWGKHKPLKGFFDR